MSNLSRSASLKLLALALVGLAAYNALGVLSGGERYAFLQQLPLDVPAAYLVASRAVWAVGWGVLAWGLWRPRRWARWGTLIGAAVYLGHGWLNRLVWGHSDYAVQTAPWSLGVGLLAVALTAWLVMRSAPWQ
jgi:hypothetical protein